MIIRKWKICLILLCLLRLACPHVVFEEFGTMAGSVSYMHITLHINLTHVNNLVNEYTKQAKDLRTVLCNTYTRSIENSTNPATKVHLANQRDIAEGVIDTFIGAAEDAYIEIKNLRDILPMDQTMVPLRQHYRNSRSLKEEGLEKALGKLSSITSAAKQAVHAIQQAHHHRLAVDYYDPDTLNYIYETLENQAKDSKYHLLTRFPSDLFQLELSYLFDGVDVVLFLHVPMVPDDSLLTLYRLKPFPIPFSETMALLPRPSSTLLALSSSIPRSMTHIEHSDLVDCHQVNQVYLCERHGVLNNNIKSSCLGALFEQDIPIAQQICDLELVPYTESVLQLQNNWFLIYSPDMYTAYVQCLNTSSAAVPIQKGVNQIFVDPSCRMSLKNHSLTSDLSMKLDAEVTYFPWKVADLSAFQVTEEDIQAALEIRTSVGERNLFLADVVQHKHFSSRFPRWQWVMAALVFTALVALAIFVTLSIGTHRVISFRRRMRRIRDALDQIRPPPPPPPPALLARPRSRRPSIMADHDPEPEEQPPPMYPGLPNHPVFDEYELMNFTPRRLSDKFQHLSKSVSQLSARYSKSAKHRNSSIPSSRHASRLSFFNPDDTDVDVEVEMLTPSRQQPTPKLRTKTPSYLFLQATSSKDTENSDT